MGDGDKSQSSSGWPRLWHTLPVDAIVAALGTDAESGLATAQVAAAFDTFGANALPAARRRPIWLVFAVQFRSPLIYLLLGAAALALGLGEVSDALVILVVVLLNAAIGALQEGRAERSIDALRRLETQRARVVRNRSEQLVEARELVPGDVMLLEAGDAVAADARLIDGAALQVAEAALTGESVPVAKSPPPVSSSAPMSERANMLYAGTFVTAGRARAVVVATGLNAEIGRIATLAEGTKTTATPLERRIAEFGRYVIYAAIAAFVLIVIVGLLRGLAFGEILMVGVSQMVGMIPEGLPVAVTIALAVGVQRMSRRRAVIRRLAAVETLGSTTVICTDKTGTLTRNEMTVTTVVLGDLREIAVSGSGYDPRGEFRCDGRAVAADDLPDLNALIEAFVLCSDARLDGPFDSEPRWRPLGDPTEVAFVCLALKADLAPDALRLECARRAEIPFDAAAKMMATQHDVPGGTHVFIKGAADVLVGMCAAVRVGGVDRPLTDATARGILASVDAMAERSLRVLAVGVVDGGTIDGAAGLEGLRGRVTLLGLAGQIDPPRAEVADAIARCRDAGIRTVMVTGDHRSTGVAIAQSLGIWRDGDEAVDGTQLEAMSDAELAEEIGRVSVFARVHPAQKLRIVDAYQQRGAVVAMTGDGVNDAPALAQANVGVAMGRSGTEVAKEAARVVLGDDSFATLVAAIEEGRVVYRNIKKAVLLLFSTSFAEVLVLLLAMILGLPLPFVAVQILWNNLVTEGLITINLVMEPAEGDEMRRPPISAAEPLLTRIMLMRMAFMVPTMVAVTLGWFAVRLHAGVPEAQARTEAFTLLAICEWYNVLNCRSETQSALRLSVLRNPWLLGGLALGNLLQFAVVFWAPLNRVFHTVPFGVREFVLLGLVGSAVLWVEEARKSWVRRRSAV